MTEFWDGGGDTATETERLEDGKLHKQLVAGKLNKLDDINSWRGKTGQEVNKEQIRNVDYTYN